MNPAPAIAASTGPYPQAQAWSGARKGAPNIQSARFRHAAKRRPKPSKP
jgi:hypothetical protein